MNIKYLIFLLRRLQFNYSKRKISGFTLIELMVSIAIAIIIVSGLMTFVVQLLSTDQQESEQTQTQNDMQLALDYITTELREAVYVYSGECLTATGEGSKTTNYVSPDFCPGVVNYIKTPSNSVPIIAFWKLDTLPKVLITSCGTASPPAGVPCTSGRTYTLVVYFLRENLEKDTEWAGKARLLRYELPNYQSDGNAIASYVNPETSGVGFRKWPWQSKADAVINLQTDTDKSPAQVLVDFVDSERINQAFKDPTACPPDTAQDYYRITPPDITATPFAGVRSFYACVKVNKTVEQVTLTTTVDVYDGGAINQDVLVFLRGNTKGRGQAGNSNNRPTLKAQVLRRSIVNKNPKAIE